MNRNSLLASMLLPLFFASLCLNSCQPQEESTGKTVFAEIKQVKVNDSFWSPKFKQWSTVTANDVFDKFEGKYQRDPRRQQDHNAFVNFDDVAAGQKGTGEHAGFPWFDGLIYESIRGISDLLIQYPDAEMEARIDGFIDRIYAAQQADPKGYINTYTDLIEPDHRWGDNGGFLRWQHDVYNAGMLVEAGVHYYQATGKIKLLEMGVRFANYMCDLMGPAPKRNIVPSHSGPEEAMIKLYWLFGRNPELKQLINIPVNEQAYWELVTFWIENRGNHSGSPLWLAWGNEESEQWIREEKYKAAEFGANARPTWGDYAQDSISVFEQKTIEGHAVRATLLATGIATAALENQSPQYIQAATDLWENMVGKRMFVTGGVGAVHHDEKFGPDYYLPTGAYLETCAAVGAGFFSQRMNELTGDAKYMDEFERALYNNVLTGISLSGDKYTYQNPLNAHNHSRWGWHDCPCCPPMFLKLVSALPGYIYAYNKQAVYVNLFIGSETTVELAKANNVRISQETHYPREGLVAIQVDPEKSGEFALQVRIPGWAQGIENPYGLYTSNLDGGITLSVNGEPVPVNPVNGYAEITRKWSKGDRVELQLPMQPRIIRAHEAVKTLSGQATIASGPLIYCMEEVTNEDLDWLRLDAASSMELAYQPELLGGINVVKGVATDDRSDRILFTAIPYYAVGNSGRGGYKVWMPQQ